MKGKIRKGSSIYQDFRFFIWPECFAPLNETIDPDALFDIEWDEKEGYWTCTAMGYGHHDHYGCGSIKVKEWMSVIMKDYTKEEIAGLRTHIVSAERHYRDDKKHIEQKARDKQRDITRCMDRVKSLKNRVRRDENIRKASTKLL